MCQKLYCFCRVCQSFYPSKKHIRIKNVRCAQYPKCKVSSLLLDKRHEECKQKRKSFLAGVFSKKDDKQKTVMPLDAKTAVKVAKIEKKKLEKKQKKEKEEEEEEEEEEEMKNKQTNTAAPRSPFADIVREIDLQTDQGTRTLMDPYELADSEPVSPQASISSEYESDGSCKNLITKPGSGGLKNIFWTPKNLGNEYSYLLSKREF